MTIQPSILIWTLITFGLMMLILNRLLFKPMLAFMDRRQAKIDEAKAQKMAGEQAVRDAEAEIAARRKEAARINAETAAREIKEAHDRADGIIKKAENERDALIAQQTLTLDRQTKELSEALAPDIDRFAHALADKLVK